MALCDEKFRSAKPVSKTYKLTDRAGMVIAE